jgi:hypothetical protein
MNDFIDALEELLGEASEQLPIRPPFKVSISAIWKPSGLIEVVLHVAPLNKEQELAHCQHYFETKQ